MSGVQERSKLVAKRGHNPNDPKQRHKEQSSSKNYTVKSLKRRLSNDGEVPNKKTSKQSKPEQSGHNQNISSTVSKESKVSKVRDLGPDGNSASYTTKPKDTGSSKNSAKDRLARLRKNLKDTQSTSRSEGNSSNIEKKTNHISKQNVSRIIKGEPSFKSANFKIPLKKSANDRIKLARTDDKSTAISQSPKKGNDNFKKKNDVNENLHESPLKKLCSLESTSSHQKLTFDSTNTGSSNAKSAETSFRLSNEYIIISEASESESSPNNLTPINQRLNNIKDHSSSSSNDKTLTPSSPNKLTKEAYFKTPVRPGNVASGLKVPLNRHLFKNRTESAVQTDRNIFRSPRDLSDEEHIQLPAQPTKNIFGAQVAPNVFQNSSTSPETKGNIFASSTQRHNNNTIFSQTNIGNNVPGTIFGAKPSNGSIFSRQPTANRAVQSSPDSDLNSRDKIHQLIHSSETVKAEIRTDKPQISPQKPIQISRQSATDRLARIKNEGCNTYRKNVVSELPGKGAEFLERSDMMESEQIMGQFTGNPLGSDLRTQEFGGSLQLPGSPGNRQTNTKEFLTENWINSHQGTSNDLNNTINDSMLVNVDDTILNKSELQDPIEDVSMDWDTVPQPTDVLPPANPTPTEPEKENIICVVTDTNVFMHFLHKVKDTVNLRVSGPQKVKIFLPWMVLKELDHLKDHSGEPTRSIALDATRFINRCLVEPDSKIIGQSVHEVSDQEDIGKDPDDKILSCCMQAVKKYKTVILLTNDINLRNKAIACEIETCPPRDVSSRLNLMMSKFCKIRSKLVLLWSKIICDCCKQAFGDVWKKMDMLQNPPWSMAECIKRFKKYWGSVFRDVLLKQCLKIIDGLHSFLTERKGDISDDSDDFVNFMKLILDFLLFLQDLSNHKDYVKKTLKEITDIADGR